MPGWLSNNLKKNVPHLPFKFIHSCFTLLSKPLIYLFLGTFLFQTLAFQGCLAAIHLADRLEEESTDAQWLSFPEKEFAKYSLNDSEFLYNNNMYDVISQKTGNGTITLLCKMDAKEKELLEKILENFKHSKSKKELSFSFYGDISTIEGLLFRPAKASSRYGFFHAPLRQQAIEKYAPPPKA